MRITLWCCALVISVLTVKAQQSSGFDLKSLDDSAAPCDDFFQYACGGWNANNPIPADQARWGTFDELRERNLALLRGILEAAAANPGDDPIAKKIGNYYGACMNESEIEKAGLAPLNRELALVGELDSKDDLAPLLASLHASGVNAFFTFGSQEDFDNPTQMIADLDQAGLGLPDRDYYLKDQERFTAVRKAYREHVKNMFELAGDDAETAAAKADTVMEIETELAQASMDRVERRDPNNVKHPTQRGDLNTLTESFEWEPYFAATPANEFKKLNVSSPGFLEGMEGLLEDRDLDDIKTYLSWHVIHTAASMLPKAFVDENFNFYGKTLSGAEEIQARWKRCTQYVDADLGEALGQKYVAKYFPPTAQKRMASLVDDVEQALRTDLGEVEWMSPETKQRALRKLEGIRNKIGHPEKWRDYSDLEISPDDALGNSLRSNAFSFEYSLGKISKDSNPKEWHMSPPTVNAYYHPLENTINFPAGILQPPFFNQEADDALNYGAIGAVIGHELTHGFDDSGRKFDYDGSLRDWWTAADAKAFDDRAQCFVDEYGAFEPVPGVRLNGKLTLGENTADNGGLRIAMMALDKRLQSSKVGKIDGFAPLQRLFLGWAQVWCGDMREAESKQRATTDPHSPGRFRVNGVVSNMPEFREAFSCKAGAPMAPEKTCRVW